MMNSIAIEYLTKGIGSQTSLQLDNIFLQYSHNLELISKSNNLEVYKAKLKIELLELCKMKIPTTDNDDDKTLYASMYLQALLFDFKLFIKFNFDDAYDCLVNIMNDISKNEALREINQYKINFNFWGFFRFTRDNCIIIYPLRESLSYDVDFLSIDSNKFKCKDAILLYFKRLIEQIERNKLESKKIGELLILEGTDEQDQEISHNKKKPRFSPNFTPDFIRRCIKIRTKDKCTSTEIIRKVSYDLMHNENYKRCCKSTLIKWIKINKYWHPAFRKKTAHGVISIIEKTDIRPWFEELSKIEGKYKTMLKDC